MRNFDVLIVGGGVAGMTAAIYAKRRGKNVCIIEKFTLGGQVLTIDKIENFPTQKLIDGLTLCGMMSEQVKNLGIEVIADDIISCNLSQSVKTLTGKKDVYQAKSVIVATGLSYVELGKNEDEYLGKGVSYCAICDANFYKNKPVIVVSKKGSGIVDANILSEVCSKVTILDSEDMSAFASVNSKPKIEVVSNATVKSVFGKGSVEGVKAVVGGKATNFDAEAVFVCLGKKPTKLFDSLKKDQNGFIITDENMRTSVSGVFAVGDVRSKPLKQIVTACADGAIAGANA